MRSAISRWAVAVSYIRVCLRCLGKQTFQRKAPIQWLNKAGYFGSLQATLMGNICSRASYQFGPGFVEPAWLFNIFLHPVFLPTSSLHRCWYLICILHSLTSKLVLKVSFWGTQPVCRVSIMFSATIRWDSCAHSYVRINHFFPTHFQR